MDFCGIWDIHVENLCAFHKPCSQSGHTLNMVCFYRNKRFLMVKKHYFLKIILKIAWNDASSCFIMTIFAANHAHG